MTGSDASVFPAGTIGRRRSARTSPIRGEVAGERISSTGRGVAAHHGVGLDMDFPVIFGARRDAYERPLAGDAFRFARHDSIEAAWRTVQPLLDAPPPPEEYPPGI